ncbi:unnamed protein product [Rhodiola kirilowii]
MADLGQQTVDFSTLVNQAAGESYSSLKELVEQCRSSKDISDAEKKISLLKFINKTQQRMLRLDVLSKWCQQVPLINYCQQLASTLSNHETCFTQAADSLFFMHDGLQQARAPIYDVPSATEILLTGTYQRFPKCVEEIGSHGTLPGDQQQKALKKLDTLVRSKLLDSIPKGFSEVKVSDGTVLLRVDGEYKVLVTLGYRGHLNLWRILHLELLVGEKSGPAKLDDSRRYAIGDDLERRMATATDPFVVLHSVLHELCVSLIMDTVIKQVQALRQGRWKGAISFDLVSDSVGQGGTSASTQMNNDGESESVSLGTPGLKIMYWVNTEKTFDTSGSGSCPYITVEPGSDMQIKCLHSSFVVDPITGMEAEISLETSCIDVEKLLLQAIYCNIYTRLLEIQRELVKNSRICQNKGDIVLEGNMDELDGDYRKTKVRKCEGNEMLRVRAYGSSYFLLGICIRTGQFRLQLSRNFLAPLAILEFEESLDQGKVTAAEVFISLRNRSILHLFASIGRFLGLEIYENGMATLKFPKNMFISAASLLMGFPNREGSYFLLLQLDNKFKPLFHLLKCQSNTNVVVQVKTIDTDKMLLLDDEVNLSVLDLEKVLPLYTADSHKSRHDILSLSSQKGSENDTGCAQSTYPSFVDDVFEHLKAASTFGLSGCSDVSPISTETKGLETSQKRKIDYIIHKIPSLCDAISDIGRRTKRKRLESVPIGLLDPLKQTAPRWRGNSEVYSYADCMAEADKRSASNSIYVSALVHVVKHCSLSINCARLTSQMESLKIPYTEEIGLTHISSNLWLCLPSIKDYSWPYLCLQLDNAGSMNWNVTINDQYFRDLCQIRKGNSTTCWGSVVYVDNTSLADSHIHFDPEGVTLCYKSVEVDSIQKLIADVHRLSNARMFALGMKKLIEVRSDQKEGITNVKFSEQLRKSFKIDKVGLTSLWFTYVYGGVTRFVVEWQAGKEGCTMHVSPEHLWPHTKFLEDFVNEADIASLLDCICLTAGPMHALAAATRTARSGLASVISGAAGNALSTQKQGRHISSDGFLPSSTYSAHATSSPKMNPSTSGALGNSVLKATPAMAIAGRVGPSVIASSLLPTDVSIVLRGPYWIQIIYRKKFAINMRCFAGDQVWLQPATPPKGGPSVGGSLSCPQFRPFIMEHVAQEMNAIDSNILAGQLAVGLIPTNSNPTLALQPGTANNNNRVPAKAVGANGSVNPLSSLNLGNSALAGSSKSSGIALARTVRKSSASGLPAHKRGELNAAIVGLGDDGGYGGGWVPLVTLKKVLRSVLKYLGVLWLFSQLPDLLKEILGSVLKETEGALMNQDAEQPALRFFVGSHVFAVTVHRVQLNLQVLSVKRFQQQPQQTATSTHEELSHPDITEICDYFSRRVTSEPYDVSRVASFITLLTLPIPVLREFLKLIAWKTTGVAQAQGADLLPAQKPSIELSLERHAEFNSDSLPDYSTTRSNIHYNRAQNVVEFGLTAVLDASQVPHVDPAGGSAWLPYCVSVRLRYSFGENHSVSFARMEGSHGGQAFWARLDEWEKCKKMVAQTVEANGSLAGGVLTQGRLKIVADNIQKTLELCVQRLKDGVGTTGSTVSGRT